MTWRDDPSTFAQRRYLFNLRSALGQSTKGIHTMTKGECGDAIDKAIKDMKKPRPHIEFNPDSVAAFETEEYGLEE